MASSPWPQGTRTKASSIWPTRTSRRSTRRGLGSSSRRARFTDLIVCLTEFSKNMSFQKKSLQAMETLKSIVPTMLKTPECPLSQKSSSTNPSRAPQIPSATDSHIGGGRLLVPRPLCLPRCAHDGGGSRGAVQRAQLLLRGTPAVRRRLPLGVLGYPLAAAALSHLHGAAVAARDDQRAEPRGAFGLAVDHHDPGAPQHDHPVHALL